MPKLKNAKKSKVKTAKVKTAKVKAANSSRVTTPEQIDSTPLAVPEADVEVFGDLEALIDSKRRVKGLSNGETLRMNYEKGLYPYPEKLPLARYERIKLELQSELLKVQSWVRQEGERIVSIFEGRDAAGKGGTIKRFMEHLNPRAAHVVALEKPTARELGQWYFQRYVGHLPTAGEMRFFDRSWYNRAGVERVMGLYFPRIP